MKTHSRFVFGSLAGALVIHFAMVACSSGGEAPASDGGVLADVRRVVADVLDAETRDANAGGDGGVPACNCVAPPEYSFSGGAVTREGMPAQEPQADFSTATVAGRAVRGESGTVNTAFAVTLNYSLRDGATVTLTCSADVRPDRSIVMTNEWDLQCTELRYTSRDGLSGAPVSTAPIGMFFAGTRVTELAEDRVTMVLPSIPLRFTRSGTPAGMGALAPITVNARVPGARWFTPSRAYRP